MSLQELQEQVRQLSVSDRLTLISTIIQSLQDTAQDEDWEIVKMSRRDLEFLYHRQQLME
jgi:hypothetical protein